MSTTLWINAETVSSPYQPAARRTAFEQGLLGSATGTLHDVV